MKLIKSLKNGVYTRTHSQTNIVSYIITYKINGRLFKKKLGNNTEGWTVNKAFRERAKRIGEAKPTITVKQQKQTLDEVAEEYFISISYKADYNNTKGRYNNHIRTTLGTREIRSITVSMVQSLKLKLSKTISQQTGRLLSEKSINDRINLVNTIYNYYNKINYTNPIPSPATSHLVERYSCDNARTRFLSKEEYQQLLIAIEQRDKNSKNVQDIKTSEMLLYVKLLTTTGMRTYSALTLRAKDFNFEQGTIQVKNHKSNRIYTSFINQSIKEELQQLCESIAPDSFIFGQSKEPYHRTTINKRLLPIMNRLFNQETSHRRERVVVHTLRHTFGSWLAQQGTSIYIISKLMDHKDISMTQRYSKLSPDTGKDLIAKLL